MTNSTVDVTIIGGGPVGLFASFYAGLRGMSVRIIDSLPELGGQLTALYPEKFVYDMPGFPQVLAKDLAAGLIAQGTQFNPELVLGVQAHGLEKDGDTWVITDAHGNAYPTRTVIIAAGNGSFSPTKIGIDREDEFASKGFVHYGVRNKEVFRDQRIAIVGGGDSAFDWALNLNDVAKSIAIIHRRDQFRAHEDTVDRVKALGIEFCLWSVVSELAGDGHLTHATLENTQSKERAQREFDHVVVNIGFKSSLGSMKDWGLEIQKMQFVVDSNYQTNLPGVFAVGDVCTHASKLKLIATGVGEAATAVCVAKTLIDPSAKLFPGHSSDMDVPAGA
jgi:thioredoxin reductase (NADPH)